MFISLNTNVIEISSYSSQNSSSSRADSTSRTVLVKSALLIELSEELALVAELSEELALELFCDTFRTAVEPALLKVPPERLELNLSVIFTLNLG